MRQVVNKTNVKIEKSGGNVFRDLGLPEPDTHMVKAKLVMRIQDTIREGRITQAGAAEIMGISQPDASRMLRGHYRDTSVERLMLLLAQPGCRVDIIVKRPRKRAFPPIRVAG
jgi:predicted XRE-type DNA-binding protein